MSKILPELKYTDSHEWVRDEGNGIVTIGISDHAQDLLGDLVHVDLPDVGAGFTAGDEIAVVESVKAASDVYAPIAGEVVEVNEELEDSPELVNTDPYNDGWLFKLKVEDEGELDSLLDAEGYEQALDDE
ncbi:glycine cleavage system protein H [Catenovulum agarivorans DS-2]|uniref:Glycine cleavage system H protein n=1 Tax=Catenovulum agarivorans DS-2 TaxID=1328313 RepID=W7QC29_9ALTE|nr:glycine cleavage system protein GcvH [Catenovulum agarivorans]EWH10424.1 glycine cleavage system protein H [Catenovulum agarivorans DS-2]